MIVRKICCVLKRYKNYFVTIFKALKLKECLQCSLRYIIRFVYILRGLIITENKDKDKYK